ncbi:MAG: acetyl-CoA carboxylase biotin carboxylase subunit [Bacillota bacterium]
MFKKVLIANRGEIAVRVIRACKEMGISTVAVYSEADKDSMHVHLADESVCIGGPRASESYLNMFNILSAALVTKAEAIHPGYGLLSENSKFVGMCKEVGIKFIGPSEISIETMGNKQNARTTMIAAKVPVVPGSIGVLTTVEEALECADKIGYPVMIKAANGGGGRGIRRIFDKKDLPSSFENASSEAIACFGDGSLYMEKLVTGARHIEVQVLADSFGNTIHLGERDCSIQRKNQKIIEEAPGSTITPALRKKIGETAVRAAKAAKYENAGTIEFLMDNDNSFYFMEMNTRIQVEHPVTEMITGVDLIKQQLKVAAGLKLEISQKDIEIKGHSIECRINAEDPANGFMPACGTVEKLHVPGGLGVRFDSMVYQGYKIPPYYDSMVGKLIVHAEDRKSAIERMNSALDEFVIKGVTTNIEFLRKIIHDKNYIKGDFNTSYIEKWLEKEALK